MTTCGFMPATNVGYSATSRQLLAPSTAMLFGGLYLKSSPTRIGKTYSPTGPIATVA